MLWLVIVSSLVLLFLVGAFIWAIVGERIREKRYNARLAEFNACYWAEVERWSYDDMADIPEGVDSAVLSWTRNLNG